MIVRLLRAMWIACRVYFGGLLAGLAIPSILFGLMLLALDGAAWGVLLFPLAILWLIIGWHTTPVIGSVATPKHRAVDVAAWGLLVTMFIFALIIVVFTKPAAPNLPVLQTDPLLVFAACGMLAAGFGGMFSVMHLTERLEGKKFSF